MYKAVYRGSKDLSEHLSEVTGVNKEVLMSLQSDDDWSFVVKSSAILESLVTSRILGHLCDRNMKRHVDKLSMNGASGKVNLALDLNLINTDFGKICELFSVIRNNFVHSTDWLGSSIKEFIEGQSEDMLKNMIGKLPKYGSDDSSLQKIDLTEMFHSSPRDALFICLTSAIAVTVPASALTNR